MDVYKCKGYGGKRLLYKWDGKTYTYTLYGQWHRLQTNLIAWWHGDSKVVSVIRNLWVHLDEEPYVDTMNKKEPTDNF